MDGPKNIILNEARQAQKEKPTVCSHSPVDTAWSNHTNWETINRP